MANVQKITPCLWFDSQAEEAAKFYVSIFRNSRIGAITHFGKEGFDIHGRPAGSVLTVTFVLEGQEFTALNAELSKVWKPIVERKPAPPDADDWKDVKEKKHLIEK